MGEAKAAVPLREIAPSPLDRWVELGVQTEYGASIYVCRQCGRRALTPEDKCPVNPGQIVPCSAWPLNLEEYWAWIDRTQGEKCIFLGTVTTRNGEVVQVNVPISEELAKELTVVDAELKMAHGKTVEKALRGMDLSVKGGRKPLEGMDAQRAEMERARAMQKDAKEMLGPIGAAYGGLPPGVHTVSEGFAQALGKIKPHIVEPTGPPTTEEQIKDLQKEVHEGDYVKVALPNTEPGEEP